MDNEPYRDLTHGECCAIVEALASQSGYHVKRELRLPNGRIADVAFVSNRAQIEIVEVKLTFKQSLVENAWRKYADSSNCLWVAVPSLTRTEVDSPRGAVRWSTPTTHVGLLRLSREGALTMREPLDRPMLPALYEQIYWRILEP